MSLIRGGKVLKARPGQVYQAPVVFKDSAGKEMYIVFINTDVDDADVAAPQFQALPKDVTIGIELGELEVFVLDNGASDNGVNKRWQLMSK